MRVKMAILASSTLTAALLGAGGLMAGQPIHLPALLVSNRS